MPVPQGCGPVSRPRSCGLSATCVSKCLAADNRPGRDEARDRHGRPPGIDKWAGSGLNAAMSARAALALACLLTTSAGAAAMVGGAAPAPPDMARHVVLIVGSRGN